MSCRNKTRQCGSASTVMRNTGIHLKRTGYNAANVIFGVMKVVPCIARVVASFATFVVVPELLLITRLCASNSCLEECAWELF